MSAARNPRTLVRARVGLLVAAVLLAGLNPLAGRPAARADDTPAPETVTIAGTFQADLGCPEPWQPGCDATALTYDEEDALWRGAFDLPAGEHEYKVALNGAWDENYGAGAERDGGNIALSLPAAATVTFLYSHATHWVADGDNHPVANVPGSFQDELGCPTEWAPDCLRTWLQDPDGDGVATFTTAEIPAGDYEAKVAIGESWDENYGAEGEADGANIPFSVPVGGAAITFSYDTSSNLLTIEGGAAQAANLALSRAHWVTADTIAWPVTPLEGATFRLHHAPEGGIAVGEDGALAGGQAIELTLDPDGLADEVLARFPHLAGAAALTMPAGAADARQLLKGQLAVAVADGTGALLDATGLQIPGVLDDLYAYDGPLGVTYEGDVPTLRLWAPTARAVTLNLYPDAATPAHEEIAPTFDPATGVWTARGEPGWTGRFYLYEVDVWFPGTGPVPGNLVTDPYSLSLSTNSRRSQVVDLADPALMPEGWADLAKPALDAPEDSVLYELHVRDFSAADETVPPELRGTFAAFGVAESDGMRHLRGLAEAGLTHVHLLPAFDIATVEEDKTAWRQPDPAELAALPPDSDEQQAAVTDLADRDPYNWGYDPFHYTVPEGSYATDPDGPQRVLEFRQMVTALNGAGLRVVLDVVYNHTNASGQDPKSVLDRIVPGYYHRLDADGRVETSTCCQNTATEHAMMGKLMVDSVRTWATAYKVDGFRFDLMGHHMVADMREVRSTLDALTPEADGVDGPAVYVYGEGWNFGEVADGARGENATQLNLCGEGIGTFNDRLRDGARGGGPFSGLQEQGFLTGLALAPNEAEARPPAEQEAELLAETDWIRLGLAGNLRDYELTDATGATVTGADLDYNGAPAGYACDPQEQIVYVSAHDNETLFDAVQAKAPAGAAVADRGRMQTLGLALTVLSQGVPFVHAGDDLLRSKSLDRNSYDSGDWFNELDFSYATTAWGRGLPPEADNGENWPVVGPLLADPTLAPTEADIRASAVRFRDLLQIRAGSPLFRLRTAEEVQARVDYLNTGPDQTPGLIVLTLDDREGGDVDPAHELVVVVFNAAPEAVAYAAPDLTGLDLTLHPVQAASSDPVVREAAFDLATGTLAVPGRTAAVFVLDDPTALATPGAATPGASPAATPIQGWKPWASGTKSLRN